MLGYEKVNRRLASRPASGPSTAGDRLTEHRVAPSAKPHGKTRRRLVDLSAGAAEPPCDSIARETEIVALIALADDFAERPSAHDIAAQLGCLADPARIRRH